METKTKKKKKRDLYESVIYFLNNWSNLVGKPCKETFLPRKLNIPPLIASFRITVVFCKQCQHRSQLVFIGTLQEALTESK
jgi:hypothetical protein